MTALGDASEKQDGTHLAHSRPPFCHCEERRDAAIQRTASGIPPHRPGLPHHASDWIATSVLFETFLAMT
jgi:hypothetical protein